jgi:hypothetical protein
VSNNVLYHGLLHINAYLSQVEMDNILHSVQVSDSYEEILFLDLLQILILYDHHLYSLKCYPDYLCTMYYTEVPDYIATTHYYTVVALHTIVHCYTLVVLEIVACDYTVASM